jgi:hypothetical protein
MLQWGLSRLFERTGQRIGVMRSALASIKMDTALSRTQHLSAVCKSGAEKLATCIPQSSGSGRAYHHGEIIALNTSEMFVWPFFYSKY